MASDGYYYMNGMPTCSDDSTELTTIFWNDFEFGADECSTARDFEYLLEDQLYILETTTSAYQQDADYANENCCLEYSDYSTTIVDWQDQIDYINAQIQNYDSTIQIHLEVIRDQTAGLLATLNAIAPSVAPTTP